MFLETAAHAGSTDTTDCALDVIPLVHLVLADKWKFHGDKKNQIRPTNDWQFVKWSLNRKLFIFCSRS